MGPGRRRGHPHPAHRDQQRRLREILALPPGPASTSGSAPARRRASTR